MPSRARREGCLREGHRDVAQRVSKENIHDQSTEAAGIEKELKRRADVGGLFPNENSIARLVGAVLLEANDDWQLQHRTTQVEGMAELDTPQMEDASTLQITPEAA